jgi:hypothetical protein
MKALMNLIRKVKYLLNTRDFLLLSAILVMFLQLHYMYLM